MNCECRQKGTFRVLGPSTTCFRLPVGHSNPAIGLLQLWTRVRAGGEIRMTSTLWIRTAPLCGRAPPCCAAIAGQRCIHGVINSDKRWGCVIFRERYLYIHAAFSRLAFVCRLWPCVRRWCDCLYEKVAAAMSSAVPPPSECVTSFRKTRSRFLRSGAPSEQALTVPPRCSGGHAPAPSSPTPLVCVLLRSASVPATSRAAVS